MKGGGSRGVRRSRRGGRLGGQALNELFGGGKRPFRKRTCRSKSRCGGAGAAIVTMPLLFGVEGNTLLGGGKRTFRKRTCRSKSRCGGVTFGEPAAIY